MIIEARGHLGGDARVYCEELALQAENWSEAKWIALFYRVVSDPEMRSRLLQEAERIEAEQLAELDPVFN